MMKAAVINWLNYHITIELSAPEDDNTIYVEIHRQMGAYDHSQYNSYVNDYRFSAPVHFPVD